MQQKQNIKNPNPANLLEQDLSIYSDEQLMEMNEKLQKMLRARNIVAEKEPSAISFEEIPQNCADYSKCIDYISTAFELPDLPDWFKENIQIFRLSKKKKASQKISNEDFPLQNGPFSDVLRFTLSGLFSVRNDSMKEDGFITFAGKGKRRLLGTTLTLRKLHSISNEAVKRKEKRASIYLESDQAVVACLPITTKIIDKIKEYEALIRLIELDAYRIIVSNDVRVELLWLTRKNRDLFLAAYLLCAAYASEDIEIDGLTCRQKTFPSKGQVINHVGFDFAQFYRSYDTLCQEKIIIEPIREPNEKKERTARNSAFTIRLDWNKLFEYVCCTHHFDNFIPMVNVFGFELIDDVPDLEL